MLTEQESLHLSQLVTERSPRRGNGQIKSKICEDGTTGKTMQSDLVTGDNPWSGRRETADSSMWVWWIPTSKCTTREKIGTSQPFEWIHRRTMIATAIRCSRIQSPHCLPSRSLRYHSKNRRGGRSETNHMGSSLQRSKRHLPHHRGSSRSFRRPCKRRRASGGLFKVLVGPSRIRRV